MICNMKEILEDAKRHKYAVGAFNTPNLESLRATIDAAEENNAPVIVTHAQVHQSVVDIELIAPLMLEYAKKAKVPVCVHLDHGTTFEYVLKAIRLGFTSVMFDRSSLPFENNITETAEIVKYAHMVGVSVEGALGRMPGNNSANKEAEFTVENDPREYTDPVLAGEFVGRTGCDILTVSIGSIHCMLKDEINITLDIDRLLDIQKHIGDCKTGIHGGSGISFSEIRRGISNGITKINYYTDISTRPANAIVEYIRNSRGNMVYYHDIANLAQRIIYERTSEVIRNFLNIG